MREDGQYDIEAEITDNKTYSFPSDFRGDVTPDQFVHHMKVRITIDRSMTVSAAEAITIAGPYAVCPTANDVFGALVGLKIGPDGAAASPTPSGAPWLYPYHRIDGRCRHHRLSDALWRGCAQARAPVGKTGLETAAARGDKRASALANSCVAYAIDD